MNKISMSQTCMYNFSTELSDYSKNISVYRTTNDVTSWHMKSQQAIKLSALVAHWHSDSCTTCSCRILIHSTGAGITRMQLAKVVITIVLVLAACAEGLPEGNFCVWKCLCEMLLFPVLDILIAILKLFIVQFYLLVYPVKLTSVQLYG